MAVDGTAIVRYFEGNQYIGERRQYCCGYAPSSGIRTSAYWPNLAYFCPLCGEIWARGIYEFQFDYQPQLAQPWAIESRRCASHGDGYLLTGLGDSLSHLSCCSTELLAREALLLCLHHKGPFV